jgi:hypothetical protein
MGILKAEKNGNYFSIENQNQMIVLGLDIVFCCCCGDEISIVNRGSSSRLDVRDEFDDPNLIISSVVSKFE